MRVKQCFFSLMAVLVVLLTGCAGTVQREAGSNHRPTALATATYRQVALNLTDAARKLQPDNPQFNPKDLSGFIERRLDGSGLLAVTGQYQVNVTIEEFRVRSAVAAVMLGIMAGTDSINGRVQVVDATGHQIHAFKVNASYGLGGFAGGQDGMRMNWLYDKFAELTLNELSAATKKTDLGKPVPASPVNLSAPAAVVQRPQSAPTGIAYLASGYANIDDVDAIPYLADKGRDRYRDWLTKSTPRAFAISPTGVHAASFGLKPTDESMPKDPVERAVVACNRVSTEPCRLYAVNGAVVWTKASDAAVSSVATPAPKVAE